MQSVASAALPRTQHEFSLEAPVWPAPVPSPPCPGRLESAAVVNPPVAQPKPVGVPQQLHAPMVAPVAEPMRSARVERTSIPAVSLEDACRLLKVTQGSAWQEIDLARRKLVMLSHPRHTVGTTPERQEAVRHEARLVKAAYATLSAARAK